MVTHPPAPRAALSATGRLCDTGRLADLGQNTCFGTRVGGASSPGTDPGDGADSPLPERRSAGRAGPRGGRGGRIRLGVRRRQHGMPPLLRVPRALAGRRPLPEGRRPRGPAQPGHTGRAGRPARNARSQSPLQGCVQGGCSFGACAQRVRGAFLPGLPRAQGGRDGAVPGSTALMRAGATAACPVLGVGPGNPISSWRGGGPRRRSGRCRTGRGGPPQPMGPLPGRVGVVGRAGSGSAGPCVAYAVRRHPAGGPFRNPSQTLRRARRGAGAGSGRRGSGNPAGSGTCGVERRSVAGRAGCRGRGVQPGSAAATRKEPGEHRRAAGYPPHGPSAMAVGAVATGVAPQESRGIGDMNRCSRCGAVSASQDCPVCTLVLGAGGRSGWWSGDPREVPEEFRRLRIRPYLGEAGPPWAQEAPGALGEAVWEQADPLFGGAYPYGAENGFTGPETSVAVRRQAGGRAGGRHAGGRHAAPRRRLPLAAGTALVVGAIAAAAAALSNPSHLSTGSQDPSGQAMKITQPTSDPEPVQPTSPTPTLSASAWSAPPPPPPPPPPSLPTPEPSTPPPSTAPPSAPKRSASPGRDGDDSPARVPPPATPSARPTRSPSSQSVLRPGDKGADVRALQAQLKLLGFWSHRLDGWYSGRLRTAVVQFQRAFGVRGDPAGVCGPATFHALQRAAG
ncbi:peptidoglycan-binding domain-containing protein [Streptomyces sp. MS06]|uniref:peptidoglycan-binding domain-containing protein n=1 Tax=Streptomyces sp. MS06 TaxID=3385974 RepID=UPI0039A356D1